MTSERTEDAKRRAVARGVPPFPNVPPGYRRRDDGTLEPDDSAEVVADAFRLRAEGATVLDVRMHLREHGIERSYHGTQALLGSRIVLGELHFGEAVNEHAHRAIVDHDTWRRVQDQVSPRGPRPKSERLLARLGVLRCGTCGSKMVIGFRTVPKTSKRYAHYRCPPIGDCPRRVTISADVAEQTVVTSVKKILAGMRGTASVDAGIAAARADVERAESELDAAVRAFSGLDDVDATRERLTALRGARDAARERLDELHALVLPAVTVSVDDWDILTVDERRDLIRAVVERATVAPGRDDNRITVQARI